MTAASPPRRDVRFLGRGSAHKPVALGEARRRELKVVDCRIAGRIGGGGEMMPEMQNESEFSCASEELRSPLVGP